MASRKQIAANRRNAQLSTGPKTPEGKAAVRFNALKHGLTAERLVTSLEDDDEFNQLRQAYEEHFQPVGPVEATLVQQIVVSAWRLNRLRGMETGLFEIRLIDHQENLEEYTALTRHDKHALVFLHDARGCNSFSILGRYETRIERAFYRALHELQRLRSNAPLPPAPRNAERSHFAPEMAPNPAERNDLPPIPEHFVAPPIAAPPPPPSPIPQITQSLNHQFTKSPNHQIPVCDARIVLSPLCSKAR